MFRFLLSLILSFILLPLKNSLADIQDPYDPFDSSGLSTFDIADTEKTAEQLLQEAELLFIDERPLDARSKLLLALQKDPDSHEVHTLLAGYYLIHVGHFKLALKYIKQSLKLFQIENGPPPYDELNIKTQHAHQLHLLSQIRLNLDNYSGALTVLDEYTSYGYYQDWYAGSRAWILMKDGKLDEAIQTARMGLLTGSETGRTLNILGILLSMKGERHSSLQVFERAIAYEFSLGERLGQPATPLNNSGEVYREIFNEEKAEQSWRKATSLPDGCEHVLPSLNLAVLMIEQTRYKKAKNAIDNFESCTAQFPLRNGEEHRALVHLARGRIAMHSGDLDAAIRHLEEALKRQQWFGKIGTSEADLKAAATISLAQALKRKNNRENFRTSRGFMERIARFKEKVWRAVRSRWLHRRARQILSEDLAWFEDLYVRNTDSMLEYPTLGENIAGYPRSVLESRLQIEQRGDNRSESDLYYLGYLAENLIAHGEQRKAAALLNQIISEARPTSDEALKLHTLLLKLGLVPPESNQYAKIARKIFLISRAGLVNYGYALPVNFSGTDKSVTLRLQGSAFLVKNSSEQEFIVSHSTVDGAHSLRFSSRSGLIPNVTVKGGDLLDVLNRFTEEVFREKI